MLGSRSCDLGQEPSWTSCHDPSLPAPAVKKSLSRSGWAQPWGGFSFLVGLRPSPSWSWVGAWWLRRGRLVGWQVDDRFPILYLRFVLSRVGSSAMAFLLAPYPEALTVRVLSSFFLQDGRMGGPVLSGGCFSVSAQPVALKTRLASSSFPPWFGCGWRCSRCCLTGFPASMTWIVSQK